MSKSRSAAHPPETKPAAASVAAVAGGILAAIAVLPACTTPALRAVRRAASRALRARPPEDVLAVARALLLHGDSAHRFVAYELIASHSPTARQLDTPTVESLGQGMATWGEVDCFSCLVAGPAWRDRQLADATILHWAASPDRWWRRAALVATVPLNARSRGGSGDPGRTLALCAHLLDDRDDLIVKALSWALRELAKRDPAAVGHFLRDNAARLAARVVREVTAKLTTGRRRMPVSRHASII